MSDLDAVRAELARYGLPETVRPGDITVSDLMALLPYDRTGCTKWADDHLVASGDYETFEAYDPQVRRNKRIWRRRE